MSPFGSKGVIVVFITKYYKINNCHRHNIVGWVGFFWSGWLVGILMLTGLFSIVM